MILDIVVRLFRESGGRLNTREENFTVIHFFNLRSNSTKCEIIAVRVNCGRPRQPGDRGLVGDHAVAGRRRELFRWSTACKGESLADSSTKRAQIRHHGSKERNVAGPTLINKGRHGSHHQFCAHRHPHGSGLLHPLPRGVPRREERHSRRESPYGQAETTLGPPTTDEPNGEAGVRNR
jgi:hypothetical protein